MCYYITNKRENGMTTMIETVVHFVSLSAKVSFFGKTLIITPVCSEHLQNSTRDSLQQIDSFIVPHIRPERLGKREETER